MWICASKKTIRGSLWGVLLTLIIIATVFYNLQNNGRLPGGNIALPKLFWLETVIFCWYVIPLLLSFDARFHKARIIMGLFLLNMTFRAIIELLMMYVTHNWHPYYGIGHDIFSIFLSLGLASQLRSTTPFVTTYLIIMALLFAIETKFALYMLQNVQHDSGVVYYVPAEKSHQRILERTAFTVLVMQFYLIIFIWKWLYSNTMNKLRAVVVDVNTLSEKQRKMMYILYTSYYAGCDKDLFYNDLSDKQWAIILSDKNDIIRGFSTLFVSEYEINHKAVRSVFSGDTIIQHEYWGDQSLTRTWCRFAGELKAQQPDVPLYWFLIVKGQRTYRYLRIFSKKFYPTYSSQTPKEIKQIMAQFGQTRFGNNYHADTGLVQFNQSHGYLKQEWSGIETKSLSNKDVTFFLQQNPGYQKGDELVCLTELSENNLQRFALGEFREGLNSV